MFPGKRARVIHPRVTDDRFVLAIDESNAAFDVTAIARLLQEFRVLEVEERLTSAGDDLP